MPYSEAGQALRDALAKTRGRTKAGVITSIGMRRDAKAVALLVPLLNDPDLDVARAATGALGRIATPEASKALYDFLDTAPEPLRPALAEGLLAAGQRLVQDGRRELAARIYEDLFTTRWPTHVRMGAFRGLVYAQPDQAPTRLIEALGGDEPLFRDMASQIIGETSGADSTKRFTEVLPELPLDGQAALLRGLANRKDPAARPAVAKAVNSPSKPVKIAAIRALQIIGSNADVPVLAELLALDDADIADAAKASLTKMQGENVNPAISAIIPDVSPAVRAQLLGLLVARQAEQAVPMAVKSLGDRDAAVRIAALRTLSLLGGNEHASAVVAVVEKAADSAERTAAEKALCAICSRHGEDALPPVLDAVRDADPESHVVLLRALRRIGGRDALGPVLAALNDSNEQIVDEAVHVLSDWPTLEAAPHLLELTRSDTLTRQVLGLRGYVRLARIEPSTAKKTRMLTSAMDLARRPDEKKLVIAAWGELPTEKSLSVLVPLLDDDAVRNEAALAVIKVAANVGEKSRPRALDALKTVLEKCRNAEIRESAQEVLAKFK
jgi:HEAT repeat protein